MVREMNPREEEINMATTRRDQNRNFFKWEPVGEGNSRFTKNAPPTWLYELIEMATDLCPSEEEHTASEIGAAPHHDDASISRDILNMTPTNEELLRLAEAFPPAPEWFKEDEERPF
jgi:hypothetical protein